LGLSESLSAAPDAADLDCGAAIHDDCETGIGGDPGGLPVDHAKLEPEAASPCLDGFPGMRDAQLRTPKDVDDVESAGRGDRLAERPKRGDPEYLALVGVDGDTFVALVDEVAEDPERRATDIRRGADDGDPSRSPEEIGNPVVVEERNRATPLLEVEIGDGAGPIGRAPVLAQVVASRS
jgi:hypothetical protein